MDELGNGSEFKQDAKDVRNERCVGVVSFSDQMNQVNGRWLLPPGIRHEFVLFGGTTSRLQIQLLKSVRRHWLDSHS